MLNLEELTEWTRKESTCSCDSDNNGLLSHSTQYSENEILECQEYIENQQNASFFEVSNSIGFQKKRKQSDFASFSECTLFENNTGKRRNTLEYDSIYPISLEIYADSLDN